MEKTLCQKCFHYEACKAIDLSGALGDPQCENIPCMHYIDSDRVKIQDQAEWVENVRQYPDGDVHVTYRCSHCGNLGGIKAYGNKEWTNYYLEHYRDYVELSGFCKKCGSVMKGRPNEKP